MNNFGTGRSWLLLSGASLALISGAPAAAQTAKPVAGSTNISELVVTAEKRETKLESTPLAISAVTGAQMLTQHITSLADLSTTLPNFQIGNLNAQAQITIRGLGTDYITFGNESRVAYNLDGVYISRPAAALATFYDVDRIEVVRGPQGALYGRNATGGAVNVITENPTDTPKGYLTVDIGNYLAVNTEGSFSGPIADNVSALVAFRTQDHKGYGLDPTNNQPIDDARTAAGRAKIRFNPSPLFNLILSADYMHEDDHSAGQMLIGYLPGHTLAGVVRGGVGATGWNQDGYYPMLSDRTYYGFSADADAKFGPVDFRSITGYRNSSTSGAFDDSFTSLPLINYLYEETSKTFSQEFRFSGDAGRLHWLAGLYYFHEDLYVAKVAGISRNLLSTSNPMLPLSQGAVADGYLTTNAYAGFGQIRFDITHNLTLDVGGRYSIEDKHDNEANETDLVDNFNPSFAFPAPGTPRFLFQRASLTDKSFTPSVTLDYTPSASELFYLKYSRGFKSGGWNLGFSQPAYQPELVTDYEAGVKLILLDGRLITNLSAFDYEYSNIQVTTVILPPGAVVTVSSIQNAAKARINGGEFQVVANPAGDFRLEANLSYLNAKYLSYFSIDSSRPALGLLNLSGNWLDQAPEFKVSVAPEYTWRTNLGEFILRGEGIWTDKQYFTPYNQPQTEQPAYYMFNASLRYTNLDGNWSVTAYVRNIGNKLILASSYVGSGIQGFPVPGTYQNPRLYGVMVSRRF